MKMWTRLHCAMYDCTILKVVWKQLIIHAFNAIKNEYK